MAMFRGMLDFVWLLNATNTSALIFARALQTGFAVLEDEESASQAEVRRTDKASTPPPGPSYKLELYRTPECIAEEWRTFERTAVGTPFQSYSWVSAWCRNVAEAAGEEPLILAGRD